MADKNRDIREDDIRIIGQHSVPKPQSSAAGEQPSRGWLTSLISLLLVALIGLLVFHFWPKNDEPEDVEGVFETSTEVQEPTPYVGETLGSAPVVETPYTEKLSKVINDVQLTLYIPHNATPVLYVGNPDEQTRKSGILAFQAADIRADNRKILGAFVLKGQPLAWGLSKKGFCAIINDEVTVGVSENSPLFEEATEKDGYFFRQYPLVDNGKLVENEPKNKTMRKALCDRGGEIFVAVSETDESLHDFAQALVDLGVDNAIYLVGSHSSFGWAVYSDGSRELFGNDEHKPLYKNENYIIWK